MNKSKGVTVTNIGKGVFKCVVCDYELRNKKGVELHLKYTHKVKILRSDKVYCTLCSKMISDIKTHVIIKHRE